MQYVPPSASCSASASAHRRTVDRRHGAWRPGEQQTARWGLARGGRPLKVSVQAGQGRLCRPSRGRGRRTAEGGGRAHAVNELLLQCVGVSGGGGSSLGLRDRIQLKDAPAEGVELALAQRVRGAQVVKRFGDVSGRGAHLARACACMCMRMCAQVVKRFGDARTCAHACACAHVHIHAGACHAPHVHAGAMHHTYMQGLCHAHAGAMPCATTLALTHQLSDGPVDLVVRMQGLCYAPQP